MDTSASSPDQRRLLRVALGVVFGYLILSASEPLRLNWGDPWSDANVLTALNFSSKYGFIATSFTDVLDVGRLTDESYRYTHYPPFAEILYGCVRKIAGGRPLDIAVYRVLAIAFAGVGLNGFYRYVRGLWGRGLAQWATILCATNLLWLQFADSIHQAPILFASGMTALAAIPAWARQATRRTVVVIAVGTYVCFLTAYDYYVFLPMAALLSARMLGVPIWSRRMLELTGIIASAGTLALMTKGAFVTGALGWNGFVEDVHFQFLERATAKFSPDYRSGYLIVLLARWASYFTPLPLLVCLALFGSVAMRIKTSGIRDAARTIVFGKAELHNAPGSILLLLFAGLPFVLVFSELAVEQVLPSQVMLPFCAVASAYGVIWLGRARPALVYAALVAIIAWQGAHFARVPKAFIERDTASQIGEYLRTHDTADFVVTNLLSDGPVQYLFDRHLHMPHEIVERAPDGYAELASKTRSGVIHAVFFEDPNGRFVDKGLWWLLPRQNRWGWLGAPYLFRREALGAIAAWDARVLDGLRRSGEEVMRLPGVRIFRLGHDVSERRLENAKLLTEPTRFIDFGRATAQVHKLSGFRFAENYPGVPGFCWGVGRTLQRTVLTKRGLVYRNETEPRYESVVLVRFDQNRDQRVRLVTWGAIRNQTLGASIDGKTVLQTMNLGSEQTRREITFVVPMHVLSGDPIKEIVFSFGGVADYGGGVAFALMNIDAVDEEPAKAGPH